MVLNKKSQVFFYTLMLGVLVLVLALALAPPVRDFTTGAMNETSGDTLGMNCSGTTDPFVKVTCVATDLSLFYFIGFLIIIAGAIVSAKFFMESNE